MDAENAAKVNRETVAGTKKAMATKAPMASPIRASIGPSAGIAKMTGRKAATAARVNTAPVKAGVVSSAETSRAEASTAEVKTVAANKAGTPGAARKGYRRSDERIQEEINDQLTQHGDIDATEIMVKVTSGVVTLTGLWKIATPSAWLKTWPNPFQASRKFRIS